MRCNNVRVGYIRELPEDLIKKIAAGEVIERPASVVKELVENSIDANATNIEIETERGCKFIKVADNGSGIDPADIDLLFKRHATSKIQSFEDLWSIETLGFRGEALASISAVSKITCRSKNTKQEYGFEVKVINGNIDKKSSGISQGTVFEIDDLFYNVPARQKFLKSENTELGHIHDIIISLALSHPNISFKLTNNGNLILSSTGLGDLKTTITELLGNDLNNKLIPIFGKNHFLDINGYAGSLEIYRGDRKSIFIFINNRPVKCQIISKAIQSAFEGLLPNGKFPIIVLNFNFKSKFVDVNVHPAKKEVRYTHPNDVYNLVLHSIQNATSNYYKKEYKEKSVYALPLADTPTQKYTEAALDFYSPSLPKTEEIVKPIVETIHELSLLFLANNLKCKIIISDKPIANMTKIGNKTIFETGLIFENNVQVVFTGEITGDQVYQKHFFNKLSELSSEIYKNYSSNDLSFQKKLIHKDLDEEEMKEIHRKKPQEKILYEVWERDNWTCVYCGKQLLDSKIVKEAMSLAQDAFVSYINEKGEKVTNHILREHIASYDHYLPASKLPQFNFEPENLYACCFECNRKKSDSMDLNSWKPIRKNNWDKPLKIAGVYFITPKTFEIDKIKGDLENLKIS